MKEAIKKNWMLLFFTIIFSVLSSIAMVGLSLLMQGLIDKVMTKDMVGFKNVIISTLIYCVVMGIFYFTYDILSKLFIRNITKSIRSKVFSGIFRNNYKDFTSTNTADYISVLTNDMKLVEENYIVPFLLTLQFSVMFIATVGILLWISPFVTFCLFISMALMFIVPSVFGKALENKQLALSNQLTSFTARLKDMFSGYDVIRTYNIKRQIATEFEGENKALADKKFEADKLLVLNETLSQLLGMGTQFIAIAISAYLVIKGDLTMGMLIAIVQLSGTFVHPVIMIMSSVPKITGMKAVLKRIDNFSNYEDNSFKGEKTPSFHKSLDVNNLTFSYNETKEILKGVNLTLDKNKKYAIVGPSACGKSTLVKLLMGYYVDYNGNINFDGVDIKGLNIEKLNKMISIIHQNVYMFDKTIKDNICLYGEFSKDKINNALLLSGADKFINDLDEGINYKVGENGSNLSGGQKQRIAIARALIQDSPILVLDEGTSAIDMQTGYDIESKLLDIEELTLITITHKMSEELLGAYDEIIFMDNGIIVEKGSLEELLKNKNRFFDFYNLEIA